MKAQTTNADPPRIYYVDGVPAQASARYRVFNALEQLRLNGAEGILLPQDYDPDRVFSAQGGGPTVLIIHRAAWDERLGALIEAAHALGIRVLYDIDDLVFEPIAIPWVRALSRLSESEFELYEDGVRRCFRALKNCDGVLTTTRALASYAAAEGVPSFVHRNGLDQRSLDTARAARQARKRRDEIVLYYGAGSGTHDIDFQACAAALERLLIKRPTVRLLAQGDVRLGYGLDSFGQRVQRWPWMPWPDYFQGIAQADVNLAPLELGNPFCEVKSELKWFEAALMGVPTVASATEAFGEVIRTAENGFVAKTQSEWFEILEELVSEPNRRQSVGATAESEVLTNYQPAAMGLRLIELLSRVATADNLMDVARAMEDCRAIPAPPPMEPAAPAVALDGRRSRLDGLALDVMCRGEDGILGELQPGKEVAQTFKCQGANLAAIAVKAALPERTGACSLEMSLYEKDTAEPLQRMRQSSLEATNHGWVTFRFSPLADSAGKGYRFVVSSPDAGPGNACALYHARDSTHRDGKLDANGGARNGALVFQAFVERTDSEEIQNLIRPEQAGVVDDLSRALAQRDAGLAEKDSFVAQQGTLLAQKDALLAQKEADLMQRDAALAAGKAALAQRDRTLHAVADELDAIRQSKGFRLLKGYGAIVRRLFPPNSPLGAFYRFLIHPLSHVLDVAGRFRRR